MTTNSKNIYKLFQLNENGYIKRIVVFLGQANLTINDVFSEKERKDVQEKQIEIIFSRQSLHKDDSVRIIKKKILKEFLTVLPITYDEIYLFSEKKDDQYSFLTAYKQVTENEKYQFTHDMMAQYLINIGASSTAFNKDIYTYEDLQTLPKEQTIKIALGQKFDKFRDPLFTANPFDVVRIFEKFIDNNTTNVLKILENELLLNYGNINNIFICFAEDVYKYADANAFSANYFTQIYFPFLFKKGILNNTDLLQVKERLLEENSIILVEDDFKLYETIDMFYNIHQKNVGQLTYVEDGIKSFKLNIETDFKKLLPLEIVFKNIHATKTIPFIKYNPGSRRENIYRLYSTKIAKNGNKIPYLSESILFKLSKEIGKPKQIALYIDLPVKTIDLSVSFDYNGNIIISGKMIQAMSLEELNKTLSVNIQPIINNMNYFLQNTGYSIRNFSSLTDDFITLINMKYISVIDIDGQISLKKIIGCISSVFDVIDDDIIKGARMIFKRVENFKEMDAQSALIYEIYKNTENKRNVITALMENYKMSENAALERFGQFLVDNEQMNDRFVENPGFPVTVKYLAFEKKLVFEVDDIISIGYLEILKTYIDSIGQILKNSAKEFTQKIDELCKSQIVYKNVDKSHIENIVQTVEQPKQISSVALGLVELKNIFDEDEEEDDEEKEEEEGKEVFDENDVLFDIEEEEEEQEEENENKKETQKNVVEEEYDENDVFFDLEDEEEDEDEIQEEEEEEEKEKTGGEITENPIDNTSLTNPNPFQTKLEKSDAILFSTRLDNNFKSYTTFCQSSAKKQPVILTEEEKRIIDERDEKNGSQSYVKESAFKYGSDPNKQFWYICPRYFCLLTNTPISKEEVDKGTCGKIIPQNAKKIPKGHYVYEFNNQKEHNDEYGNYIQHHPGFGKETTPEGFGIPCCYKNWKSKVHTELRKKFLERSSEDTIKESNTIEEAEKTGDKINFYVVNPTKFPVPKNRWGFLPPAVELFLQIDNNEFVTNDNRTVVKKNTPALLRYGVEFNDKQSFLGCIADIYSYQNLLKNPITIQELRTVLLESISLDIYIKLHNSSLVSVFLPKKINYSSINIDKYRDTAFFQTIDLQNDTQRNFLESTIASFENFQHYLQDSESIIDHTYLWDVVSIPNPKLIRNGLNLIILEITNKDTTNNIELLCPTNAYSDSFYNSNKGSLLLLKQEKYYEPIYLFENKDNQLLLTKLFFEQKMQLKHLKKILLMIKSIQKSNCAPITNYPKEYQFRKNITVTELKKLLLENELYVIGQVVNYQSKVIGLLVNEYNVSLNPIFVPCLPSGILKDIPVEYMENDDLWSNYQETTRRLLAISQRSNKKILCKPELKVIDDGLIVGIITETNQFVQINPPAEDLYKDDLITINQSNFILADKELITGKLPDVEREKTVQNIVNESKFYAMFRSKVRQLINEYENRNTKKQILQILSNKNTYKRKIFLVENILLQLANETIVFQDKTGLLQNIDTDINAPLYLPKVNLVHQKNNEKIYFLRMADELIRYNRIRVFMLNTNEFLNITDIEYKINDDEFIILQSYLTPEYFKNLIPFNDNPNIQNNIFEMVNPIMKQQYSNEITLSQQYSENAEEDNIDDNVRICIRESRDVIGNPRSFWRRLFPKQTKEIIFKSGERCSFAVILYIMQKLLKRAFSVEIIKQSLIRFYEEPFRLYKNNLINLFRRQWNSILWKSLRDGRLSLPDAIMSESYLMTDLDIMLLSKHFKLPIVLFSTYKLKNLFDDSDNIEWLVLNNNLRDKFYFIRSHHTTFVGNKPVDEEQKSYCLIDNAFFIQELHDLNVIIDQAVLGQTKNIFTFDQLVMQS